MRGYLMSFAPGEVILKYVCPWGSGKGCKGSWFRMVPKGSFQCFSLDGV